MDSLVTQINEGLFQIASYYTKLSRKGHRYWGLSPFVAEKTPSFAVSGDKWYCFSTSTGGDAISLVRKVENCSFSDAVRFCADILGLDASGFKASNKKEISAEELYRLELAETMKVVAKAFHEALLEDQQALSYLRNRGVSDESISKWEIGISSIGGYKRIPASTKKRNLLALRILFENNGKAIVPDSLRNRIFFPFINRKNEYVGFSARVFMPGDIRAKYYNSSDSILFHKSEEAYGLNLAQKHINRMGYVCCVEGQMDAILAHQHGYPNTIALSGTAVASNKAFLYASRGRDIEIVSLPDRDAAGFKASVSLGNRAIANGKMAKIAFLPEGEDPASVLTSGGSLTGYISEAKPWPKLCAEFINNYAQRGDAGKAREMATNFSSALEECRDPFFKSLAAQMFDDESRIKLNTIGIVTAPAPVSVSTPAKAPLSFTSWVLAAVIAHGAKIPVWSNGRTIRQYVASIAPPPADALGSNPIEKHIFCVVVHEESSYMAGMLNETEIDAEYARLGIKADESVPNKDQIDNMVKMAIISQVKTLLDEAARSIALANSVEEAAAIEARIISLSKRYQSLIA